MRLRNWLLTGTSVAVLALAPIGAAKAQSAELLAAYQTYVSAQESGDSAATDAALVALTELCIVEGYATVEECLVAAEAAVAAGTAASDAEAEAAAAAAAEAEAAAAAEAEAQAAAEAEAQAAAEAEAQAAAEAEAQAAAEAEAQAAAEAEAEAAAAAEAEAAAAAEAEAAAEAQAAADAEAQFVADLNAALGQYQEALNLAAAGDYESAQPMAAEAEARIQQLCTDNGYPSVEACIGQTLPPLPEPPAAEEPMATEEPAGDEPAAEEPATEEPMTEETPTEEPAAEETIAEEPASEETTAEEPAIEEPSTEETPAEEPAETDPLVAAQADLQTAVELYNIGVTQLEAGDADGQSTVNAAMERITAICTELGFNDTTECLSQFGFRLPPLPETPVEPAADEEQPIEELPGSEAEVSPEATEVLPEEVAPEEAAPVLDSAKEAETAPPAEETAEQPAGEEPAEEVAEEPAAPAPTTDEESQAAVEPLEVESVTELQGEQVSAADLPQVEVPPNVTVVNNIATEERRGGGRDRDRDDDDDNDDRDRGNNFTNSGFIFQIGLNLVISNPAQERDRYYDEDEDEVYYERLPRGRIKETIVRPSGVQIVTIRNRYGEVIRRSRIMPDGREIILAGGNDWDRRDRDRDRDDREGRGRDDDADGDDLEWRDPGRDLPPLRLNISIRDYILDADEADEDEVERFLAEPPVERVRQIYTIDEVKRSARIRDMVRRLEVGGLTFDTGAATISRNQVGALSKVANAMLDLLDRNPAETFLIEGHTDAVGSETSNLVLSDSRAATVARILTDFYDIPPENLVTQGYGERFLKVQTEDAERLNRRVTIKRITPLITVASR